MTNEELVKELLEKKTFLALYLQPRTPKEKSEDSLRVRDPHVFDTWLNLHASKKAKDAIAQFFTGLEAIFKASGSSYHENFLFEEYREFILSIQKLIKASLTEGRFTAGDPKKMLTFLESEVGQEVAAYLKNHLASLNAANQEFNHYLKINQIKYLPKKLNVRELHKSQAQKYLEKARGLLFTDLSKEKLKLERKFEDAILQEDKHKAEKLDAKLHKIESFLTAIPEREEKIQNENRTLRQAKKNLGSAFRAILRTEAHSILRKEAIKAFLDLAATTEKQFLFSDILKNFCQTPLEMPSEEGGQKQLPLVFAMAKIQDDHLNKMLRENTDIGYLVERDGPDSLNAAIMQNDEALTATLVNLGVNPLTPSEENEIPYQLAAKKPKLLAILDKPFQEQMGEILKENLYKKYYDTKGNHNNPFYSYKKYRDAAIHFLTKIQEALIERNELRSSDKAMIYLGALHYIESLLQAEHFSGDLHWRKTDAKSHLENLVEHEILKTAHVFGLQDFKEVKPFRESLQAFIDQNPSIEKTTLDMAYTKHPQKTRMEIYDHYVAGAEAREAPKFSG